MVLCYALLGLFAVAGSSLKDEANRNRLAEHEPTGVAAVSGNSTIRVREVVSGAESSTIDQPTTTAAKPKPRKEWEPISYVFPVLFVAGLLYLVKPSYRYYLAPAFAVSYLLFLVPPLWVSSIGLVGLLACSGILIHALVPKQRAEKSVFIGITLAFLAYVFAVAGGLAAHPEREPFERYSTAFYEATQLPLMNMSPHDDVADSEASYYYSWARIFGCLFAYFVAYKAVAYVCERAQTQFLLGWYCVRSRTKLALVIGLGAIGRRLIRNLRADGFRVVAIESDKDSVHIQRAQDLGAQVIVGDALDERVYDKIPLDAVSSIYVVAGDDRKNLEIGQQLLSCSTKRVKKANQAESADASWSTRWCHFLGRKMLNDTQAVCHVQLYDSNMQRSMEQEHFRQPIEMSGIEMRHFDARQNAVRDLVQRELTKPGIRPRDQNEIGLYILVGFGDLGREVAVGIAHLAHFENEKRARIVVFCSNPEVEAKSFLAQYPKFTAPDSIRLNWNDVRFDERLDQWDYPGPADAPMAGPARGVTFATNTLFTEAPLSASDGDFLKLILELTSERWETSVKPCVIVCDEDVNQSFTWSSEFAEAWKGFARKNGLKPECPDGRSHPSLNTYFWLQGHKALSALVQDNVRHTPFGLEENCISTKLLDSTLLRYLGSVVQYSYDLATASAPVARSPTDLVPLRFEFLKSNLHAASHSLIKYQIAGGRIDSILAKSTFSLSMPGTVDWFSMDGFDYMDPNTPTMDEKNILLTLGKMEHNRWMVEQLLKGYEYVRGEEPRVAGKRLPQFEHQRQTLCHWAQLADDEKLKDLRQAYYVLYHLHALDARKAE